MTSGATAAKPGAGPAGQPFSPRAVLALVLAGGIAFVLALYGLAASTGGSANDGNAHVGGKGLNGYAGLSRLLEADGFTVRQMRDRSRLAEPGLLVLTPPPQVDTAVLGRVVEARRRIGPTLLVMPKWLAMRTRASEAKRGWVVLGATLAPEWPRFHDEISVVLSTPKDRPTTGWTTAGGTHGPLPDPRQVLSGSGRGLVPLVMAPPGRILAAYESDQGAYPVLADFAGLPQAGTGNDSELQPLVFVFEPDLLNNWGLADAATARLARDLVLASLGGKRGEVTFDLTLNGYGHTRSLIDLAFQPPFVAATLCLLLAALVALWRAFGRFGPPLARGAALAPGKRALVENGAGLIRRAGRVRLVGAPYADALRERIAAALRLRRGLDRAGIEQAIERAQKGGPRFGAAAAALEAASRPRELARAAQALHSIETELIGAGHE